MRSALLLILTSCVCLCAVAQTPFRTVTSAASNYGVVALGDFNRDGFVDVVFHAADESYHVGLNDGTGKYTTLLTFPMSPSADDTSLQVEDLNGDGYPDILAPDYGFVASPALHIFLNQAGKGFVAGPVLQGLSYIQVADVDGDGKLDLIALGDHSIDTYKGEGNGSFTKIGSQPLQLYDPTNGTAICYPAGFRVSDFEGDGHYDLLLSALCTGTTSHNLVFYGRKTDDLGHYAFSYAASVPLEDGISQLDLASFSKDLLPDAVVRSDASEGHGEAITALFNQGKGSFSTFVVDQETTGGHSGCANTVTNLATGDLTGDHNGDVTFVSGLSCVGYTRYVYASNGMGGFSQALAIPVTLGYKTFVADLNNDNRNDILDSNHNNLRSFLSTQSYVVSSCRPSKAVPHVCSPAAGTTVTGTVNFAATGNYVSGPSRLLQLYVDGKKIGNYSGNFLNTSLDLAPGTHTASVIELEYSGQTWKSGPFQFTVKSATSSCAVPTTAGVKICTPAASASVTSPVAVSASARAALNITAMRIYVDGAEKFRKVNATGLKTEQISASLTLAKGTHDLTVLAYKSDGTSLQQKVSFTVK